MGQTSYRFCVFGRAPRSLVIFLGSLCLIVTAIYVGAILREPETPILPLVLLLVVVVPLVFVSDHASREWFEISADGRQLTAIPSWYERKFWGKRTATYEMPEGSALLICLHMNYGAFGGQTVIFRAPDGMETTVYKLQQGLPRKIWKELQDELAALWNMPVKFVIRTLSAQGFEEKEWSEEKRPFEWRAIPGGILMLLFPFSGALVRLATPNPFTILLVGLALWSVLMLYWRYLIRKLKSDKTNAFVNQSFAVAAFHNAIYYAISAIIADTFLRK